MAKKVEWANTKGNREVRTLLLRDPNKLVQLAVIHSPRITLGDIANVAQSRTLATAAKNLLEKKTGAGS